MAARLALIGQLVTSTLAEAEAVLQAVARLAGGSLVQARPDHLDDARVQAWLDDSARLAAIVCDVNHPDVKELAARLDDLTATARRLLRKLR